MYFVIYGAVAALLAYTGLWLGGVKSVRLSIVSSALSFLLFGLWGWLLMPVFAWNFAGNWFMLTVLGGLIILGSYMLDNIIGNSGHYQHWPEPEQTIRTRSPIIWAPLGIGLFMLIPVQIGTTWSLFHAEAYRQLLGEPVVSEFTKDVAPLDLSQIRRVDQALARNLGSKRIEEQAGLGSRVDLGRMNIQTIDGCFDVQDGGNAVRTLCFENELVWVGPLNHAGPIKWLTNGTTPGYIIVSAVDSTKVYLVTAIRPTSDSVDQKPGLEPINLRYLKAAYFGDFIVRHVRSNGFASRGLTDYSFEIDNTGRPNWVITRYDRTIGFSGADATGVVVVDVQTGAITEYSITDAPAWIDRIQPEDLVTAQLNYWGKYVKGFWNSLFAKENVVEATPGMSLVYGADGGSFWYSGMQSAGADSGTNSFVLVNTRTKETRRYMIGGANELAAKASAENAPGVREAGYVGTWPIVHNVAGEATNFLTLKGGDGLVKMFAFVNVRNVEIVGVGRDMSAAVRDYQNALIRGGKGVALQDITTQERINGIVNGVIQINDTFYLRLVDQPTLEFYGTSDVSPELKWTTVGQHVIIVTERGSLRSLQIYAFDIPSLAISDLPDDGS